MYVDNSPTFHILSLLNDSNVNANFFLVSIFKSKISKINECIYLHISKVLLGPSQSERKNNRNCFMPAFFPSTKQKGKELVKLQVLIFIAYLCRVF